MAKGAAIRRATSPTTPTLTGGGGRPKGTEREQNKQPRKIPRIPLSPPAPDYCTLLVHGWDSYQEAADLTPTDEFVARIEAAKQAADALDPRTGGTVPFQLGSELVQVRATGAKGGVKWVAGNDDLLFLIRSPAASWCVSIRYLAGGLWEYGLDMLRARAHQALLHAGFRSKGQDEWPVVVSRADYAFDFHSAEFGQEMVPRLIEQIVCHSSAKTRATVVAPEKLSTWSRGGMLQTIDIGSKAGLQVSIYNKSIEVTEASGKTWFYELWGGVTEDVWRLELRFGGEYLRDRSIRTHEDLVPELPAMIGEAVFTRRLTVPLAADTRRRRWALHPLWTAAYLARGQATLPPLGRYVTGRRAVLLDQQARQIAGALRSAAVLACGDFDPRAVREMVDRACRLMDDDHKHYAKIERARERYRFVDEAK